MPPSQNTATAGWALLIAAIMLLVPAPFLAPSGQATGHDCPQEFPIWIQDLEITRADGTPIPGGAFVKSGDRIRFHLTLETRSDSPVCFQLIQSDVINLQAQLIYQAAGIGGESEGLDYFDRCSLSSATGTCKLSSNTVTVRDQDGEQRIRFVVGQDRDAGFEPYLGAERVLVVDQRPNLEFQSDPGWWDAPRNEKVTTYSSSDTRELWKLNITNTGDYPTWNPNGGDGAWGRSAYDSPTDDDEGPDEKDEDGGTEQAYSGAPAETLPRCRTTGDTGGNPYGDNWGDGIICAYKRGAPLDLPITWELIDADTGELTEAATNTYYARDELQNQEWDKNTPQVNDNPADPLNDIPLVLHSGNDEGIENTRELQNADLFTRSRNAGPYTLELALDQFEDGTGSVPETDEGDNDATKDTKIFGVDLHVQGVSGPVPQIVVPAEPGCGLTIEDACPAGAPIQISVRYSNQGDEEADDTGANNRNWLAAVFLGDEPATNADTLEPMIVEEATIPFTTDAPVLLWNQQLITTPDDGGTFQVRVLLDHPDAYDAHDEPLGQVDEVEGRVAEVVEKNDCPSPPAAGESLSVDNVYCLTLHFQDNELPEISDLEILPKPNDEEDLPTAHEGDLFTFNATVTDASLAKDGVKAVLEYTNGTVAHEVTMEEAPEEDGEDLFTLKRGFTTNASQADEDTLLVDALGTLVYRVQAVDTFGQLNTSDAKEFLVKELPKTIDLGHKVLNGQSNVRGANAPEYNGTADNPRNYVNVTAEVDGTGFGEEDITGKHLQIYDPDGKLVHTIQMDEYVICTVNEVPSGQRPEQGGGCAQANLGPGEEIEPGSRSHVFYANTTIDYTPDGAEKAWDDHEIAWAGQFTVNVNVTDKFGKHNAKGWTMDLLDKNFPEGLPTLENLEFGEIEGTEGDIERAPGETFAASAFSTDELRVERVYLNTTYEDPNTGEVITDQLDLRHVAVADADDENNQQICGLSEKAGTCNGTYEAAFEVGIDGDLQRAGTYQVSFVAVDFANRTTEIGDFEIRVNDVAAPQIVSLRTVPAERAEVGSEILWEAEIVDDTAIRIPELTVQLPNAGPTTLEMVQNETTGIWNATLHAEAAQIGTWSYTLDVEDFAGKAAQEVGSIEIVDNLAPQARDWKPALKGADGTLYGSATAKIQVEIVDPKGVVAESIQMDLGGEIVDHTATSTSNGYRVSYTIPASAGYEDGDTVTVRVTAEDTTGLKTDPPLVHQFTVDAAPPTAALEATPSVVKGDQEVIGATTELRATAEDSGSGPGPIKVAVQFISGSTASASQSLTLDGPGTFRLSDLDRVFQGHGTYRIVLTPTDKVGNEGNDLQRRVLFDQSPPKIRAFIEPDHPREEIFAEIIDESQVAEAWIEFDVVTPQGEEDTGQVEMTLDEATEAWTGTIPTYPKDSTINYTVKAEDIFGNAGAFPEESFLAGDAVPTISLTSPRDGDVLTGRVPVTWSASDPETEPSDLKVSISYRQDGGDFRDIPGAQAIDNTGSFNLDTTLLPNGPLTLQALVFDGTTFGSDTVDVTVQNLRGVFSAAQIQGAQVTDGRAQVAPGQEVVFTVQIEGEVHKAWANVTREGRQVLEVPLASADGGQWTGTFKAPMEEGDYNVDLAALTADGPAQTNDAYAFQVASGADSKSFVSEWTILTVLFAAVLAVGAVGLTQRWK